MIIKREYFFLKKKSLLIFIISILYSYINGIGFFGFGIDYYATYKNSNISTEIIFDFIGWKLSTLSIYEFHLGVYLTSIIISVASGLLIGDFLKVKSSKSLLFFLIIYILTIFSWPAIVSTSNAMRQGLAMSFIFFVLMSISHNRKILSFILMTLVTFTHKSGLIFMLILIFYLFYDIFEKKKKYKNIIYFGIIIFIIHLIIFYNIDTLRYKNNRIISKDFTPFFLLINICFIFYSILKYNFLNKKFNLFLYIFSFAALALYISGLYWQYERFNMIMIIPYIFSLSLIFEKKSQIIYLFAVFSILFILTLWTGMYSEGVGIWIGDVL